jgi:large subunit ribosomal protein L25
MAKTQVEIEANKREELGKKARKVRAQGLIPAVIYGKKLKATAVSIPTKEFEKKVLGSEAGRNLIFNIKVKDDGKAKSVPVITQSIQRNNLSDKIVHLDFLNIAMDEAIKARVPVELIGVPTGVKDDGGVLVHGLREIEIKCLPGDIPDKYEVDVTGLAINTALHVSDLRVDKKIEILSDKNEMVAQVSPPTKEEEVAQPTLTPEAVAGGEAAAQAVATEEVKGKAAPGAAPATEKEKPSKEEKK